ncbi:MAG TPA: amidohydrolase family protein [Candidatus Angelobacter sp.]|nr:amidohydrolase family protein [Candidatus Angelobacter sp.]
MIAVKSFVLFAVLSCVLGGGALRGHGSLPAADEKAITAASPIIDVHTHLEPADSEGSIHAVLGSLTAEHAVKIIFMPPPFTVGDPARYDFALFQPHTRGHEDRLAMLAGGGILNPMIHESVRSRDAGPEVRRKFKGQAEELLRAGAAGFGELAAEHFPGATPYESAPPDHPLFLLLADIAAAHHVPIDLHMEAVARNMPWPAELKPPPNATEIRENIAAFERLLNHNRRARIIWAHAGWDNTGDRTPELCRRLLAVHRNLYMELKIDPVKPGKNSPLAADGTIKPEWLRLFQDFPDRFVVGSDQHYPQPPTGPERWQSVVLLINQLSSGTQKKIAFENAERLYPRRAVKSDSSVRR